MSFTVNFITCSAHWSAEHEAWFTFLSPAGMTLGISVIPLLNQGIYSSLIPTWAQIIGDPEENNRDLGVTSKAHFQTRYCEISK